MRLQTGKFSSIVCIILLPYYMVLAQWQVHQLSVPLTINFDSTVSGVNYGQYTGIGYTPLNTHGALSSEAWIIHGMSAGDLAFGDTAIGDDYGRGLSTGGVFTGGVYAMDVGNALLINRALGVQPGGSDFTPGYHLLRAVNASNDTVGSIDISYVMLEYNDQGRSSKLEFYYGSDAAASNYIPALDYISKDTADLTPAWQPSLFSTNLSFAMLPGDTVYFKWYCDDYGGSGSRDELAIDDIEVSFLPPGNQPPVVISSTTFPLNPSAGQSFDISSVIIDDQSVDSAFVIWGLDSLNLISSIPMQLAVQDSFVTAQAIAGQPDSTWLYFRIVAMDGESPPAIDTSQVYKIFILDPLAIPQAGDLLITELMINPSAVSDNRGEYIELYNATKNAFNLEGFYLRDAGGDSARINHRLIIDPRQFLVLARDSVMALNGGFKADYQYSGFTLSNLNDEVYLLGSGLDTIDVVEYNGGAVWLGGGAAMTYVGAVHQDNSDLSLWSAATHREPGFSGNSGDLGSPGKEGNSQVVDHLVYVGGAWSDEPDSTSGHRQALVRSGELVQFVGNARVRSLVVEPLAGVDIGGYRLSLTDTLFLLADSTGYSRLIGEVDGRVCWLSNLRSHSQARWFNLAIPLNSTLDSVTVSGGGRINTLADVAGDTGAVNIWTYDAGMQNPLTGEGTWRPVLNRQKTVKGVGFSFYSGDPYFGQLPQIIEATGRVDNQDVQISLSNHPGNAQYNFIANPFTSLINWDEITADNPGLNKTYFIYDDGPDSAWVAYNSISGIVMGSASDLIAPGQAFFVNANGQSALDIEKDCRSLAGNAGLFRRINPPGIHISVTTEDGRSDHTYLGFSPLATDSLDTGIDALKRKNPAKYTPSIYSLYNQQPFMYNFVNDNFAHKTYELELELEADKRVYFDFNLISIDPAWRLELEEVSNNSRYDLRNGSFHLNHLKSSGVRKFSLHLYTAGLGANDGSGDEVLVEFDGQQIYNGVLSGMVRQIEIVDVSGRSITQVQVSGTEDRIFLDQIKLSSGIYVMVMRDTNDNMVLTRKILID